MAGKVRLDESEVRFIVFYRMLNSVDDCTFSGPRSGPIGINMSANAEIFGASLNSVGLNRSRFSDLQVSTPLICIL